MSTETKKDGRASHGAFQSTTFEKDISFHVDEAVGSASISPSGRDVVLASREGLHIIDLDNPYSPPRRLPHRTPWEVADVQWSPFASRDSWIVSTSNQKALVWNLEMSTAQAPIEHILHAHTRAITDINFSAHNPDMLATCAIDSFVHCWDLRRPNRPVMTFADWFAGATQVKYNRQDSHVIASSHDKFLHIWDDRKGSTPLRTIEAHTTKIYGIDWSRTSATCLLTCSLDMTIKLWDYPELETNPKHMIRVPFPIWRARHTPFGHGILAMPQRGNNELHLYDERLAGDRQATEHDLQSVHSFTGHENQVKEFLWRSRGGIEDGRDNRDFQLVSWGTDRTLMLHRVNDSLQSKIGYRRGQEVDRRYNFTRRGAAYKTFRDDTPPNTATHDSMAPPLNGLSSMFGETQRQGMRKAPMPTHAWGIRHPERQRPGMRVKAGNKKDISPITWMKGVKINKTAPVPKQGVDVSRSPSRTTAPLWGTADSLGDEITFVGDKYKKVFFEKIDVSGRALTLALNGPWGVEQALAHVKVAIEFPQDYPEKAAPGLFIEKTSSISTVTFKRLTFGAQTITQAYANRGRGCLEAIICYLLGERDVEESTAWLNTELFSNPDTPIDLDQDSSSDEDEGIGGQYTSFPHTSLDLSTSDLLESHNPNVNVPLPKACGAQWAKDGRLICFFPRKEEKKPWYKPAEATAAHTSRGHKVFEGLGWLPGMPSRNRVRTLSTSSSGTETDTDSRSSSDFSTSTASFETNGHSGADSIIHGSTTRKARSVERSLKSSVPATTVHKQGKSDMFVSMHNLEDMLPSKRSLAEGYIIFGHGATVCAHNAAVARACGYDDIGDLWDLLGLILANKVPLEIMPQSYRSDEILVLARRALLNVNRKDSGLDLAYDKVKSVGEPELQGRVKWGHHPCSSWLIEMLFTHFENMSDVQMLAMMSCVLSEPAAEAGVKTAVLQLNPKETQMSMTVPAFSLDYFSSLEAAWSMFKPEMPFSPGFSNLPTPLATFGSFHSSNGPWGSDTTEVIHEGAISTAITPPALPSHGSHVSLSDNNAETPPTGQARRSSTSVSNSITASFARPFAFLASTSPTSLHKEQPVLSTSAPTASAITWGRDVILNENEVSQPNSFRAADIFEDDDDDAEEDVSTTELFTVAVSLKNQNMVDDEGCVSVPLLYNIDARKLRAYRGAYGHLLNIWNLPIARCEVLKFNGMSNYFDSAYGDPPQSPVELGWSPHQPMTEASTDWPGLGYTPCCVTCGDSSARSSLEPPSKDQCESCRPTRVRLPCSVCNEAVRGLYKACAKCGHIAHFACLEQWLYENGNVDVECEAGCGCFCSDYAEASLDFSMS